MPFSYCECPLCQPDHPRHNLPTSEVEPADAVAEPDDPTGRATTFGFELEFGRNVASLAQELARIGLTGCDTIHGWHCDCPTCCDEGFDFKVQSDSTADGEIISRVFTSMRDARFAMQQLQEAAVKVDAEPNMDTGLHVHVARPTTSTERTRALLAFVAWEPALTRLAQGRFHRIRSMNSRVTELLVTNLLAEGALDAYSGDVAMQMNDWVNARIAECAEEPRPELAYLLYQRHLDNDRHSNLCIRTRFNTWEFRIWNSTRSAWRMELATRLAIAWDSPEFIDHLLAHDATDSIGRSPEALRDIVAQEWQGDDRLAALIDRQVEYLPHAAEAPREFLVA